MKFILSMMMIILFTIICELNIIDTEEDNQGI